MSKAPLAGLLEGRNIFVSGGGGGVNLAIADACAQAGANIAICGRTESRLESASEKLSRHSVQTSFTVADVRDREAVQRALDRAQASLGSMHGIVCGAAGMFVSPAEKLTTNGFRAVTDIDLLGSFHVAQAGFGQLCETKGALLFVSGGQSDMAFAHQAHVAAAKAGVDQLMRSLALEWGPFGIRANSVLPGPVRGTEGMERLVAATGVAVWNSSVPLGRFAQPSEVGQMAAILLSPVASFVTGTVLAVDGGMSLSGSGQINQALQQRGPAEV